MTDFCQADLDALSGFEITLAPTRLAAFHGSQGYWTRYDAVASAGVTDIECVPRLKGRTWGTSGGIDLDLYFDPATFPYAKYGMIYGDDAFEASADTHVCTILGLPEGAGFIYTEQGMQGEDFVSMEGGVRAAELLLSLSAHQILRLVGKPEIIALMHGGQMLCDRTERLPEWFTNPGSK